MFGGVLLPPVTRAVPSALRGFSFRVRNGTGRFPLAMTTETLWSYRLLAQLTMVDEPVPDRNSGTAQWTCVQKFDVRSSPVGLLVPVSSMRHCTSTSGLSTQWSTGALPGVNPVRALILKASRLDAFSGYPSERS